MVLGAKQASDLEVNHLLSGALARMVRPGHSPGSTVALRRTLRHPNSGRCANPSNQALPKATLNKSPRMRSALIWDAMPGANHGHSRAMVRI